MDAKKGASYEVNETPLQEAVGTSKSLFEWLEEKVPARELKEHANYPGFFDSYISEVNDWESESVVPRPELGNFGLSMLGGGRVNGTAHVYGMKEQIIGYIMAGSRLISEDYPWAPLGDAVVVDVGGGVGRSTIATMSPKTILKVLKLSHRWICLTAESTLFTIKLYNPG